MKKLLILPVIALIVINLPVVRVLSVSNRKNFSERIYSLDGAGEGFVISYTHSVNKGRVHDFYVPAEDGGLELYRTQFVSYGAGIPEPGETPGTEFFVTDTGYEIRNLHRKLPRLVMAVGVIAEHSVTFGNDEFFLKDFFKPQTSLVFEIKRVSVADYFITKKWSLYE